MAKLLLPPLRRIIMAGSTLTCEMYAKLWNLELLVKVSWPPQRCRIINLPLIFSLVSQLMVAAFGNLLRREYRPASAPLQSHLQLNT
jgi:hypothetical protein